MLLSIQILRAIAAYLVVLAHLQPLIGIAGGSSDLMSAGTAGVDLFFVISGFIMVFTTTRRETRPWDFFAHRMARIIPLYWLVTLLVFAIAAAMPSLVQATRADLLQLIQSMMFIPFMKDNGSVHPIVFIGWTLNYEMFFYAIFAATLFVPNRAWAISLALAILSGLTLIHVFATPDSVVLLFFTNPLLLEFALGMILGVIAPHLPKSDAMWWPLLALAAFALTAFFWAPSLWPDASRVVVFGLPSFVTVFCALNLDRPNTKFNSLLIMLGNASYSIYLTHFFVTQTIIKLANKLPWHDPITMTCWFVVAFVGVGALGIAVYVLIEKPLTAATRRFLGLAEKRRIQENQPATVS